MKTYLKAFRLKRFWLLLLLPAAFLLDFAARQSADFAEWYAVTIYRVRAVLFRHYGRLPVFCRRILSDRACPFHFSVSHSRVITHSS